jgi:hypothetical protein
LLDFKAELFIHDAVIISLGFKAHGRGKLDTTLVLQARHEEPDLPQPSTRKGSVMELVLSLFLLCAGVLFVWSMRKSRQDGTAMKAELAALTRKGFKVDYLLRGNIQVAFDASRRQVAFIYANGARVYDFSIIRDWQLSARQGIFSKIGNTLHFTLADEKHPLVKISGISAVNAGGFEPKLGTLLTRESSAGSQGEGRF